MYVPNGASNSVSVIDPATYQVVDTFPVGALPQHVVPSYNLSTLYVNNNNGNSLTPVDPRTGKPGPAIPVNDPYNLYFTPDGRYTMVMAERESQIDVRDPATWQLVTSIEIPHRGVNHADFSADGTTMIASCEFSGWVVRIDLATLTYSGEVEVGGEPIDVQALTRRHARVRRQPREERRRRVGGRPGRHDRDRVRAHRGRRARALPEP